MKRDRLLTPLDKITSRQCQARLKLYELVADAAIIHGSLPDNNLSALAKLFVLGESPDTTLTRGRVAVCLAGFGLANGYNTGELATTRNEVAFFQYSNVETQQLENYLSGESTVSSLLNNGSCSYTESNETIPVIDARNDDAVRSYSRFLPNVFYKNHLSQFEAITEQFEESVHWIGQVATDTTLNQHIR